jgi:pSer/pThr/pTyr-binding forkhead associated (FHA) protein
MLRQQTVVRPIQLHYTDESKRLKTVTIANERFVIGREEGCQLRPRDLLVSRRHAEIFWDGDTVFLRDLNSRNGTTLNDDRVLFPTPLEDGDRIAVGQTTFTVNLKTPSEGQEEASISDAEVASWLAADEERADSGSDPRPSQTHIKP